MAKGTKTTREIEEEKNTLVFWVTFILAVIISLVIMFFYVEFRIQEINVEKPKQDLTYDYKCFIPLEDGNYTIEDGILRTPSGRLIKCEELS